MSLWVSQTPGDQAPLGLNALGQIRWPRVLLYIPSVHSPHRPHLEVRDIDTRMTLMAPFEPNESWFPGMLQQAVGEPLVVPVEPDALSQAYGRLTERPGGQGRPLGGLEVHRARRLAQGFDEQSVEVMLQARKGFTNDTYNAYRSRFCSYC